MKKLVIGLCSVVIANSAFAQSTVIEGVVEKAEAITTEVGQDGRPLLGAAVGVGVGSAFGSGSGKDAAKIVGGVIGAKRQAAKQKQIGYGWRYIVKAGDDLKVVDSWCKQITMRCSGVPAGQEVYIINGNEVAVK
jgi:outer membrane lipoprotein SlyB